MVKKIISRVVLSKSAAARLIRPILRLHSWCYRWAGKLAVVLNGGVHPKHRILCYKEWFVDNIEPGWTVLDIGCNTGMLVSMLSEKAAFVYGVEINPEHIRVAESQRVKDNIEYICADAVTHDYRGCRPIDCVTLSNVLEHVDHRVDFLRRLVRQLRWADENHKRFLVRVPLIDREWIVFYKRELGLNWRLDPSHCIEYTLEEFTEELREAGVMTRRVHIRFGEIYAVCEALPSP